MGPIQSGINQIFNQLMTTGGFIAGSKAIKGTRQDIQNISKEVKDISDYRNKLAKTETPKERYKQQKKSPNVSQETIDEYIKQNPEDAEEFLKVAVKVDPETVKKFSDLDAERDKIMSDLPTYTPVSKDSIGNTKAAEIISKKAIQRSEFENLKNFTKGIQLPSSINKKVKHASLDRGMPNIKHMREAGDK